MILTEGLNQVRDLVDADLDKGQAGTGTTLPTASDTGLETAVGATLATLTSTTTANKAITTNYQIDANTGNGSDLSEYEIQFTDGESFNRVVHAPISKTSDDEMEYITTFYFEEG